MKAIFITMRKIMPLNDGALIYSYGILQYLKILGIMVDFISFYTKSDYTESEKEKLLEYCCTVDSVKLKWQSTALNISLKFPNNIRKYTRRNMKRLLYSKNINEYDLVIIDHLQMFEYSKIFAQSKIILIEHNVESNIWDEYADKCNKLIKPFVKRSARMTKEYEQIAVRNADAVISIADTDAEFLNKLSGRNDIVVMHPFILYPLVKNQQDIHIMDRSLLFIGSYGWYPNQRAAEFLVEEVMPELRRRIEGIKIYLVGKEPTSTILKYSEKYGDVIVTGLVDSVDPYIKKCDVFVNAMFEGGGMNIKMMEAMGKGIPVVSSEYGARGIDVKDSIHVVKFKNKDECISGICRLLEDREMAAKVAYNAREYYMNFIKPGREVERIFE